MNREVLLEEPNCRLIFRASVKNDRKGLPAAGLPYRPHSRHSHAVPGGEVHGGEGGAGVSQYAAFTGKGGGEEKGEKDSLEWLSKMVLVAGLGCRVRNRIQHALCWYII